MTPKERTERRGKALAQMGMVSRHGDGWEVQTPRLNGGRTFHTVTKTDVVRCDCSAFISDPLSRCEHMIAVKHHLLEEK